MRYSIGLFIGAVVCLAAAGSIAAPAGAAGKLPNIVLILADDMGVGELSSAGGIVPTPALDRMVKEGMQFTDAHTSSSVCTPTRYGILSGRYNWRSRLKSGVLFKATDRALMDPARLNLPAFLQQAGYHTACIGKWHLGVDWLRHSEELGAGKEGNKDKSWNVDYSQPFKNGPVDVGFDEAFFILSSLDMAPYVYLRNDRAVTIPTVNKSWPHNEYNDYQRVGAAAEDFDASECLADWAAESRRYIHRQTQGDKPFFLYLSLTSPHTPVVPGKQFKGRYPQYSWYADFIAETDWVVGQVLEQLKESGVDDNTLVIFTADNGFAPYVEIPKMIAAGYRPSGAFRAAKASIYEGGHRVPFLVRWPGQVEAGSTSAATICTTDFFATFADVAGRKSNIPGNAAEDSFSFYSCMKGQATDVRPFTIHHSYKGGFAIRRGDWKLIMGKDGGVSWKLPWKDVETSARVIQLYNLKEDPGETENLEDAHPEIVTELVGELAKALRAGRTTPGPQQHNDGWPFLDEEIMKHYPQLKEHPEQWEGKRSDFHGFDQFDFQTRELNCRVVVPKAVAAGTPWVWRARFWGHEPQVDIALLNKGFHVAYVDVGGMYGSPKAVVRWEAFYNYLTTQKGFSKTPALEGMSRGGLIVYNWASKHPDKVSCIYADAPVCDIKSWPGGKGSGKGAAKEWQQCLGAYGFSEGEAMAYSGNPMDSLKPLASAGVPLLHVVGDADSVVPVAENTAVLKKRYKALGGSIEVIHKPGVGHHPHGLKDPTPIVNFILKSVGKGQDQGETVSSERK